MLIVDVRRATNDALKRQQSERSRDGRRVIQCASSREKFGKKVGRRGRVRERTSVCALRGDEVGGS